MNGTLYTVATKTDFPQPTSTAPTLVPVFHLVSVTAHTAKISIAGGSYATGAPTVTLRENKPVTLMNTADGTRYTLILKPLGTDVSAGASAPSGSSSAGSGTATTPTHWLSSVMKQAGLYTYGNTRPSTIESTKGRRQLVWYAGADPYAD